MTGHPLRRPADAGEHRQARVNLRLSTAEKAEIRQAAQRTRETSAGYTARVVLMVVRGELDDGADPAEIRELTIQLIRTRSALDRLHGAMNEAIEEFRETGETPASVTDAVSLTSAAAQAAAAVTQRLLAYLEQWQRRRASRARQRR
jgi:hypothetical protein